MDKSRWAVVLVLGAVALAVVLVGIGLLLAVAALWRFSAHGGMMGGACPWCGGTGMPGGGTSVGILALLCVGATGLALLGLFILGALWLARGSKPR